MIKKKDPQIPGNNISKKYKAYILKPNASNLHVRNPDVSILIFSPVKFY